MTVMECKLGFTEGVGVSNLKISCAGTESSVSTAALTVSLGSTYAWSYFGALRYPSIGGPRYTIDTSVFPYTAETEG